MELRIANFEDIRANSQFEIPISKSEMRNLAWGLMFALLALYVVGLLLSWGGYASWHLLLVIVAILLIYNVMSRRGT